MEALAVLAFTGDMSHLDTNTHSGAEPGTGPVLVTAGTGKTGRRIVERLTARGVPVRVGSRRGTPPFDWYDDATWGPALAGCSAAYLAVVPDCGFPGSSAIVGALARQAVEAGVGRLVLLSGRGEDEAGACERALWAAEPDATVLRAAFFAQDFSEHFLLDAVLAGVVAFPAGDVAEPFVDVDDIADVAAEALTTDGHAGRLYDMTGPRLLTFAEAVALVGEAAGRDVRYVSVTPEEYAAEAVAAGLPPDEVHPLIEVFRQALDGRNAHVGDGVERALGRPARDFADFARAAAAAGTWKG